MESSGNFNPVSYSKIEDERMFIYSYKEMKGTPLSYIAYFIKGKLLNNELIRRYSDFFLLREKLVLRWPCIFIPELPPKKVIGNKEEKFVSLRMKMLNYFLKQIVSNEALYRSEEFQAFISYSADYKKHVQSKGKMRLSEVHDKYCKTFLGLNKETFDLQEGIKFIDYFNGILETCLGQFQKVASCLGSEVDYHEKRIRYLNDIMYFYKGVEDLLPNKQGLITDEKINVVTKQISGNESPYTKIYYSTLCSLQDIKALIAAYKAIKFHIDKLNVLKQNPANFKRDPNYLYDSGIPVGPRDIEDYENIILYSVFKLGESIYSFKNDQVFNYQDDIITLKEAVLAEEIKNRNAFNVLLLSNFSGSNPNQ